MKFLLFFLLVALSSVIRAASVSSASITFAKNGKSANTPLAEYDWFETFLSFPSGTVSKNIPFIFKPLVFGLPPLAVADLSCQPGSTMSVYDIQSIVVQATNSTRLNGLGTEVEMNITMNTDRVTSFYVNCTLLNGKTGMVPYRRNIWSEYLLLDSELFVMQANKSSSLINPEQLPTPDGVPTVEVNKYTNSSNDEFEITFNLYLKNLIKAMPGLGSKYSLVMTFDKADQPVNFIDYTFELNGNLPLVAGSQLTWSQATRSLRFAFELNQDVTSSKNSKLTIFGGKGVINKDSEITIELMIGDNNNAFGVDLAGVVYRALGTIVYEATTTSGAVVAQSSAVAAVVSLMTAVVAMLLLQG